MRWFLGMALAFAAASASAATIDVKIHDAFGGSYRTTNMAERLGAIYDIQFDPVLVLTLGPSEDDARVKEQAQIVNGIDPDEHGILLAVGTPTQRTYGKGFSVTPNTAIELLPSKDAFRVIVVGAGGEVLLDTNEVVSRERLLQFSPNS